MQSIKLTSKKGKKKASTANELFLSAFDEDEKDNDDGVSREDEASQADRLKRERRAVNERLKALNKRNEAWQEKLEQNDEDSQAMGKIVQEMLEQPYDQMEAPKLEKEEKTKDRKSKYIENLLQSAKQREMQHENAREKLIQKELQKENETLGEPGQVFMTRAYQKKLEERKRWEEAEKKQEQEEQANDVRQKGFTGFFNQVLENSTSTTAESNAQSLPQSQVSTTLDIEGKREYSSSTQRDARIHRETKTHRHQVVTATRRQAPKTKLSEEEIQAARERALERAKLRGIV